MDLYYHTGREVLFVFSFDFVDELGNILFVDPWWDTEQSRWDACHDGYEFQLSHVSTKGLRSTYLRHRGSLDPAGSYPMASANSDVDLSPDNTSRYMATINKQLFPGFPRCK